MKAENYQPAPLPFSIFHSSLPITPLAYFLLPIPSYPQPSYLLPSYLSATIKHYFSYLKVCEA